MLLNVALCFGQGSIKIHFNIFEGYYYFILLSCNNVFLKRRTHQMGSHSSEIIHTDSQQLTFKR